MARRAHTKSRRGCSTCKRRHIKCDEQRPTCANCRISERVCSYQEAGRQPSSRANSSPATTSSPATSAVLGLAPTLQSPAATVSPVSTPNDARRLSGPLNESPRGGNRLAIPPPASTELSPDDLAVNMRHMQYLSHFLLVTSHSMGISLPPSGQENALHTALATALRVPHLMHAMLSLAALHLRHYADAAALHARALQLFNSTPRAFDATPDSAVPTLLFASLVGIYMLADVALSSPSDEAALLDRFIDYVDVHRGVGAVIGACWPTLSGSAISPSFAPFEEDIRRFKQNPADSEDHCGPLPSLMQHFEDMGTSSVHLQYHGSAIEHLKWGFGLERRYSRTQPTLSPGAVFAWPAMICVEFVELLKQRRPEPLVILAYYGALLHRHRNLWVVGDLGVRVVHSITTLLGRYWRPWLEWPNAVVTGTIE